MKVGLIARSEDRGLGILTWEWFRHMAPDRTMIVIPDAVRAAGLDSHIGRFPGATLARFDGELNEARTKEWLDGLDVVYSAETFYDWRLITWARELGVRTVLHVMPEYFRADESEHVDAVWTPTRWRLDHLPERTRVVPVPIPTDRWAPTFGITPPVIRWLHTIGARAAVDRNGTRTFIQSLRHLKHQHKIVIRANDEPIPHINVGRNVHIEQHTERVADYWLGYADVDALVLPRRYAGLSMPALEAAGAGLALVMTGCEPQRSEWPIIPLPFSMTGTHVTPTNLTVDLASVEPREIAAVMDAAAADTSIIDRACTRSRVWAQQQSWAELQPTIAAALAQACS